METGRASKTALGVAIRRAAHQLVDHPPVLDDPLALRLVGNVYPHRMERAMHPVARDFRCFMAARSRYAEDQLAAAVAQGVRQYVILGAGLDTFAYRNPFPDIQVFEVDFPATQVWKREMLAQANIPVPPNLAFLPIDFEHHTLAEGLAGAQFDSSAPAFFGWLGVVPYLTLGAFRSTLETIARMPSGSAVSFDYGRDPSTLGPLGRIAFDRLASRVAAAGEPFQLFFTPQQLAAELDSMRLHVVEDLGTAALTARYFAGRSDNLSLRGEAVRICIAASTAAEVRD